MKVYCSRYQIKSINPSIVADKDKVREGALLKLEDGIHFCGYSDLNPYPEFGDAPLETQLAYLASGRLTALTERALAFAHTDALARRGNRNLFSGLALPSCHKQVTSVEDGRAGLAEGFSIFKMKMGRDINRETHCLKELAQLESAEFGPIKLRLDFNGVWGFAEFMQWWNQLDTQIKSRIDLIEDAYALSPQVSASPDPQIPLAWDWLKPPNIRIQIVKPTRDNLEHVATNRRVVFTHAFGHLLGQATSLWVAARFYRRFPQLMETCGLSPSSGTGEWPNCGRCLKPPMGLGFGFDNILQSQRWELLT